MGISLYNNKQGGVTGSALFLIYGGKLEATLSGSMKKSQDVQRSNWVYSGTIIIIMISAS